MKSSQKLQFKLPFYLTAVFPDYSFTCLNTQVSGSSIRPAKRFPNSTFPVKQIVQLPCPAVRRRPRCSSSSLTCRAVASAGSIILTPHFTCCEYGKRGKAAAAMNAPCSWATATSFILPPVLQDHCRRESPAPALSASREPGQMWSFPV